MLGLGGAAAITRVSELGADAQWSVQICMPLSSGGYQLRLVPKSSVPLYQQRYGAVLPVNGICPASTCTGNGGSCDANSQCCSGICQAFQCVATVGGTCSGQADFCQEQYETCGTGCLCTHYNGANFCLGGGYCVSTCTECHPGYCAPAVGDCCGSSSYRCLDACPPQGISCFTAETRIAMADGTSRSIDQVIVGDYVLGADGQVNQVREIEKPRLGTRRLYALNDDRYFVTSEHPFMTDSGWKAIDPAATLQENPNLEVGRLMVGDRLLVLSGILVPVAAGGVAVDEPVEVRVEPVLLGRIEETIADPATPLYNLRLDGNNTYFANDLLVHNK
jgi:hypothetical protein